VLSGNAECRLMPARKASADYNRRSSACAVEGETPTNVAPARWAHGGTGHRGSAVQCSCIFEQMSRTSADALGQLAADALVTALGSVNIRCEPGADSDIVAHVDDAAVAMDVRTTAYATPERVRAMLGRRPQNSATPLLVADHITAAARDELVAAGWSWLDRRGHIYLRAPGVIIDRDVDPIPRPGVTSTPAPISGAAGIAVAYAILLDPDKLQPVRASAPILGFSPASISTARTALREAGLLEHGGLPAVPELFWALAEVWRPERAWLVRKPKAGDTHTNVGDLDGPGWCLTGTAAAVGWGAPVVAVEPILDLYVPGPVMVTIARRQYGAASGPGEATASIAVAPASLVTGRRIRHRGKGRWPLAHPLAVALDLARDRARGREILEAWTPPPEFRRVW